MRKTIVISFIMAFFAMMLVSQELPDPYSPDVLAQFEIATDSLSHAAWKAYQSGDYETSAAYYLAALQYDMNNGSSLYNLACCYGLLGEDEQASFFLKKAYRGGFSNIEHIKTDPDFDKVRSSTAFTAAMDSLAVWDAKKKPFSGDEHFVESSVYLKYEVFLPDGYDEDKIYPLIIGLHGYGGDLNGFAKLLRYMEGREAIYVVPEAPYPFMVGKTIGYSWSLWDMTDDEELANDSFSKSIGYVMSIYEKVKSEYPVGKTYLMGFSQGAMLTYLVGILAADKFDGLIPIGGDLFVDVVEDKLDLAKELPIFIIHGKNDTVVGYDCAEKAVEVLEKHGITCHLEAFEGGHQVNREAFVKALEYFGVE